MLSMGRMVREKKTLGGRESAFCNGVLVAKDLVLTNKHCVSSQKQCETTHFIFANPQDIAVTECSSLIHTEEFADQSLVSLKDPVAAPFIPVQTTLREYVFPRGTPVYVSSTFGHWKSSWLSSRWRADESGKEKAEAKLSHCEVEKAYHFAVSSENDLRLMNFELNCKVKGGQSGSPVYGGDQKLIGLIWGSDADDQKAQFTAIHPHIQKLIQTWNQ
jgi:hypothetical protein